MELKHELWRPQPCPTALFCAVLPTPPAAYPASRVFSSVPPVPTPAPPRSAFAANSQPKLSGSTIPRHLQDFEDVFSKASFDSLPERKQWDHAIELLPGAEAASCKVYPLAPQEQDELDAFLQENLDSGRIRPSKSPMASPVFFIKKKDGSLRLVQDYRVLNAMMVKNRYPLPLISELVNNFQGTCYFTKLNVCWGYNNVHIKEGDE